MSTPYHTKHTHTTHSTQQAVSSKDRNENKNCGWGGGGGGGGGRKGANTKPSPPPSCVGCEVLNVTLCQAHGRARHNHWILVLAPRRCHQRRVCALKRLQVRLRALVRPGGAHGGPLNQVERRVGCVVLRGNGRQPWGACRRCSSQHTSLSSCYGKHGRDCAGMQCHKYSAHKHPQWGDFTPHRQTCEVARCTCHWPGHRVPPHPPHQLTELVRMDDRCGSDHATYNCGAPCIMQPSTDMLGSRAQMVVAVLTPVLFTFA